jgi:hypothetical protein
MEELLRRQIDLMENHDILISWFSTKGIDKILFRFYFKEMHTDYIYNPISIPSDGGKPMYYLHEQFIDGLKEMVEKADEYVKNRKIN